MSRVASRRHRTLAFFVPSASFLKTFAPNLRIFPPPSRDIYRIAASGIRCTEFHGSLNQETRERVLTDFRAGKSRLLLATDVAARGTHVNRVDAVINYDFPGCLEEVSARYINVLT